MRGRLSRTAAAVGAGALVAFFIVLVLLKAKVIVWLAALFCLFVLATIVTRGRLQNAVLSLASLTFVLCVLEGAGLYFEPAVVYDHGRGFISRRPVVGWGPAHPGTFHDRKTVNGRVAYDVTYTIDRNLFRTIEAGTTGPAVGFLGDSFIFGTGLNDPATLPQQFANLEGRKLPVFSLALPGYSPAQVLATMQTGVSDELLTKAELLVEFVAPWHAERTACKVDWVENAPRYSVVDGVLRSDGTCSPPAISLFEKSHFYKTFVLPRLRGNDDADLARLFAIARETVRMARDKYHLPIIVLYLNDPIQFRGTGWTDAKVMAMLKDAGADVLPYNFPDENKPPYTIVGDLHPTGEANAIHAGRLAAHIRETFSTLAVAKALEEKRADSAPP